MKPIFFYLTFLIFIPHSFIFAQDSLHKQKQNIIFGGFVNTTAIFDSRQIVEVREGFMAFYPKNQQLDKNAEDINDKASFNQYSMTTRLNVKASGFDVFGANTFAFVEGDFTGASNSENNSLRLRHAYIKISWKKTQLLLGQYWHPLDIPEAIPNVVSLNTGAPFHPFSRQPQIRIDQQIWKFNIVAVASTQRDYVNNGPIGFSANYLRNSIIPNLHSQLHFKFGENLLGIAIDYKNLTPRLLTDSNYIAKESFDNLSYSTFAKLSFPFILVKFQGIYGQNLNDHCMMGGYGITAIDTINNRKKYEPLNYVSTWINIMSNGKHWQFGLFGGYSHNLGTFSEIISTVYARDPDIYYVYRIAPLVVYTSGKFNMAGEIEYTAAAYGIPDKYFHFKQFKEYANLRVSLSATYNF